MSTAGESGASNELSAGSHQSLVQKGKNCVAVARSAKDDIDNGREEMASEKLSTLKDDGTTLANAAEQLAERFEAADTYYQDKDAEIKREIGGLKQQEANLQNQKSGAQSQLSYQQSRLQSNESDLSSARSSLQNAERKRREAEEEEKRIQVGTTVGGAVLGLFTGGVGFLVGAAAGAGLGAVINACRDEEKRAQNRVDSCARDVNSARSAVSESQNSVSSLGSQISSLSYQIQHLTQQQGQRHRKIDEIKAGIVILKKAVEFWQRFKQVSEHGGDRTARLQEILSLAVEEENLPALQSKPDQRNVTTFLEAWEEMASMAEEGSSNHLFEIEFKCTRCQGQYTALPYVNDSAIICKECHSKFALKN